MGLDAMILVFWMLSFKPTFSCSSFTFTKRPFSSSSLSAISHMRLLIFLQAILIPACASSSLAFHMMYSAYKLNKQGDNIQPWCSPFPIWNQSIVICPVPTVVSWDGYRFHRRQVRWSGIHHLRISQVFVIYTAKGFSVIKYKYVFMEFSFFFYDTMDVCNLISDFTAFSKYSLNIWNFMVHVLLKPCLENFEHYFASMWNECICAVVWTFFGIALLWDWDEIWYFLVLWRLPSFPDLLAYWVQHFDSIIFQDLK